MKAVLIITRADSEFGYGHLSRMVSLASFLRSERGYSVTTLLLGDEKSLGFARSLGETMYFFPAWELKWSMRRSLLKEAIESCLPKAYPEVVIFDVYDFFDTFWGKGLFRKIFPSSLFLGFDIYHGEAEKRKERKSYKPVALDVTVNATLSPFGRWESRKGNARFLVGTDYLILPSALLKLPKWEFRQDSKSVSIFLGAGEVEMLSRLLEELSRIETDLVFRVFTSQPEVLVRYASGRIEIGSLLPVKEFLVNLSRSKFAIVSAGLSLYESAYLGVPVIIVPVVQHQFSTALKFIERGFGVLVKPARITFGSRLMEALRFFEDEEFLKRQSAIGLSLLDGKGIYRVADVIDELSLGKAKETAPTSPAEGP